ncbi:MAG: class I SAM-dependent methyltransferase [Phycisphaerae bacterium]|nr:class I SAM-dependent methyltransferase [Phycisphaerae bacterium]
MFDELEKINAKPKPFEFYTAAELWTDEHTSAQMLQFHLNESLDLSSRNHAFINRSVEWIISRFNIGPDKSVADFGCGPGLYTTRLAKTGADVTGIDFSPRSIEYAKTTAAEQNLHITYINQNYLEFETDKRFDLIIMIFCDFCALSPQQRTLLLNKYRTFLKPGGVLLMDVHSLNIFNEKEESATYELNQLNGFWSADKYYGFVNSFKGTSKNSNSTMPMPRFYPVTVVPGFCFPHF